MQNGIERPIAYASRTLSKSERNYCVTMRELLAAYTMMRHFRHFLLGKQFKLRTDHSSLMYLNNLSLENMLGRWQNYLATFDFIIEHRAGKLHGNADGLSRVPRSCKLLECEHCEFHRLVMAAVSTRSATKKSQIDKEVRTKYPTMFDEETPSDRSTQMTQEVDSNDDTDPERSDHSGNTSDVSNETYCIFVE